MASKIDDRTRELLSAAHIDGLHVRLSGQVKPAEYKKVAQALENLGGKWTRSVQALVFPAGADPAALIAGALGKGTVPLHVRTSEGYVATPAELASTLARYPYLNAGALPAGATVLEPSAGDGALVRAILLANPGVRVAAIEPNAPRAASIELVPDRVTMFTGTLEAHAAAAAGDPSIRKYDAVLMNPPFSQPDNRTIWIDHVHLTYGLLKAGGRLVAIVPNGFVYRTDKRHAAMRALVDERGGWNELPDDAFNGIRTVVIWLDKPATNGTGGDNQDDRDADLHNADGSHIGTARTANGSDVEQHDRRIRAHLAAHTAGTIPAHTQPAGPPVYALDLTTGMAATVTGADPRGIEFTMTGTLTADPDPVTLGGRDLVSVKLRNRTGADVELLVDEGARVTLHDPDEPATGPADPWARYADLAA